MARYIDLDNPKFPAVYLASHDYARGWNACLKTILQYSPICDVASRREVAREIFEEIEAIGTIGAFVPTLRKCVWTEQYIELKQKYTEEQKRNTRKKKSSTR